MKNIKLITLILMFVSFTAVYACFGQQRISLGMDINKFYPESFMPDYGGNVEVKYSSTFGFSSIGIGNSIGFYWFSAIDYYDTKIRHYTIPIDLLFFKLFKIGNIDFEINGNAGFHFLFGREKYLRDTAPNWAGNSFNKGDSYKIGVWPAGIIGTTFIASKRIGKYDIGVRIGYKHIFKSPGFATDIYNPGEIGAGVGIGFQINRWFGKYVKRRGR